LDAKNFATKTVSFHKDFSLRKRDNSRKIENITIGKLGEIAFRYIKQDEIIDKDPANDTHSCHFDFMSKTNKSIDVKTLYANYQQRVYISFDLHTPADIFVLIFVDEKAKTGKYLGSMSKEDVSKNLQYDAYFVFANLFR